MMCKIPSNYILRFLDQELSDTQHQEFLKHLARCSTCRLQLEKGQKLMEFLEKEPDLPAPTVETIMMRLDKSRYQKSSTSRWTKVCSISKIWRKVAPPVTAFLAIVILLAIPLTRNALGRGLMVILDKEHRLVQGTTLSESISLTFSGSFNQISGSALVSELNEKGMGVSPWQVIYASKERILLRNYASLLVFSNGNLKKVAELDTLGLDHVQGSVVTHFEVSPDGRFILVGNQNHEGPGDQEEENGVYLFDSDTGRYAKLSEYGLDKLVTTWSFNGQWLAFANKQNTEMINILNTKTLKETPVPIPSTEVQSLFISNSGRPALYTGSQTALPLASDITKWKFKDQADKPFYIDANKGILWFVSNGYYASQKFGSDEIQSQILSPSGKKNEEALIQSWRVQGQYLVSLLSNGQISVLNLTDNSEKRFGVMHRVEDSNLPWCVVSPDGSHLAWEKNGSLVLSNSEVDMIQFSHYTMPADYLWKDEGNLVFVELINALMDSELKAGELAIKQISYQTGKISELYRTISNTSAPEKTYFNRAYVKENSLIYSEPDKNSPPVDGIIAFLADPTRAHELNLYDEVINGFVRVESDNGLTGWVREEDFNYYDNYKNFSYEKNTLDLNGDNKPDIIKVSYNGYYRDDYRLEINDTFIDDHGIDAIDQFRIVDVDPNDPYLEVVIEETGPSSDVMSSFYYYDGKAIHFMGKLEGLCGNKGSVSGNGQIIGQTRGSLLETWFYSDYYRLDGQHKIVRVPQEVYEKVTHEGMSPLKIIIPSLKLYEKPESATVSLTLMQGDEVWFLGSDDKEWCLFGTADGKKGWLKIVSYNLAAELNISADEIFEGLSHAD